MRSWDNRKKKAAEKYAGFEGEWLDVGIGECPCCQVERRLYRPVKRLDVYFCAPCTQQGRLAALPNAVESDEEVAA